MSEPLLLPFRPVQPPALDGLAAPLAGRLLCAMRYGPLGASSRLRLGQYMPLLAQAGLSVSQSSFLDDAYLRALYSGRARGGAALAGYRRALSLPQAIRRHDLLWIEKELLPWVPFWLERGVLGHTPYILDFDDAWALRYAASPSALVRAVLRNKFGQLLRGAALCIVANETLYRWATSEGARHILLLPTVVDIARYEPRPPPGGPFTIGWIGTPLTAAYLDLVAAPLRQLAREAPMRLLVIGAPGFTLPGVEVESLPWSAESEAELIGRCHAGIMPLPDSEWTNGKSGYKLIQYMAMARSAVGSAIGANHRIVQPGETGFLASSSADWLQSLRTLRDDPARASAMGMAARRRVEQHYSLAVTAPLLVETISELLGNRFARRAETPSAAPAR